MKTKNPFATIADGMESLDVDDAGFIAGTIMVIYLVGFLVATGFMGMVAALFLSPLVAPFLGGSIALLGLAVWALCRIIDGLIVCLSRRAHH